MKKSTLKASKKSGFITVLNCISLRNRLRVGGAVALTAFCAMFTTISASAQLKVNSNGTATIGIGSSTGASLSITNPTSTTGSA